MPDLALGPGRPYALVTTVVHRGRPHAQCKLAQLDLHLTQADLRLRFLDRDSLARFYCALGHLIREALLPDAVDDRAVRTRLFTDLDPVPDQLELRLIEEDVDDGPF